ncbi:hypothetical protein F4824DRAFT_463125 [Ustulina deusta]|nr:hypothetical protein F4824DRAFT_463125 [Ustulina deusta]
MARYRAVATESVRIRTQVLSILSKSYYNMVLLGANRGLRVQRDMSMKHTVELSYQRSVFLRPKGTPTPPWSGANKILPIFQTDRAVMQLLRWATNSTPSSIPDIAQPALEDLWKRTQSRQISHGLMTEILGPLNLEVARYAERV